MRLLICFAIVLLGCGQAGEGEGSLSTDSTALTPFQMQKFNHFFQELYNEFNTRNIEKVISQMTNDVKWANGMEGGYVTGQNGVREYWKRQFTQLNSQVTPLKIEVKNDIVRIEVHQLVRNLQGDTLSDQTVYHYFKFRGDKIAQFDIGEKPH